MSNYIVCTGNQGFWANFGVVADSDDAAIKMVEAHLAGIGWQAHERELMEMHIQVDGNPEDFDAKYTVQNVEQDGEDVVGAHVGREKYVFRAGIVTMIDSGPNG